MDEQQRLTPRIVPVMVVVGGGPLNPVIRVLGSGDGETHRFQASVCRLSETDAEEALSSGNMAAAVLAMSLKFPADRKLSICVAATLLLRRRLRDTDQFHKYARYVMQSARLKGREKVDLERRLERQKGEPMKDMFDMIEERGVKKGVKQGVRQGARQEIRKQILRLLARRDVPLTAEDRARIEGCQSLTRLQSWFDAAIDAKSAQELFGASGRH